MFFRIMLNFFIPPLRQYEKKLIEALAEKLKPEASSLFIKQIEQINYVQRHSDKKEVNLYKIIKGKPGFNEKIQFPLKKPEAKFAAIEFEVKPIHENFRAVFWIASGHIFSINFNKTPKKIKNHDIEITKIDIYVDPLNPDEQIIETINPQDLKGWLLNWVIKMNFDKIIKPLPVKKREEIISHLSATLPSDYIDIISQTDGLESEQCQIYGASEIRSLIYPDANYYILAEIKPIGVLAVKEESAEPEIYYFCYEDNMPIKEGSSFHKAIEKKVIGEMMGTTIK